MKQAQYPIEYYEIQDYFAKKMLHLTEIPIKESYEQYTRFRKIMSKKYKNNFNKLWNNFITDAINIKNNNERIAFIHKELNKEYVNKDVKNEKNQIGCFSYKYIKDFNTVSLHFTNIENPGISPLSSKNMEQRKKELKELFSLIKKDFGTKANFRMYSWLNNFEPFNRLFPKDIYKNAKIKDFYQSSAVWGQFLDRDLNIRIDLIKIMKSNIDDATTKEELLDSFPYKATEVIVPMDVMYKYFGV